jgi:hypothetical protein
LYAKRQAADASFPDEHRYFIYKENHESDSFLSKSHLNLNDQGLAAAINIHLLKTEYILFLANIFNNIIRPICCKPITDF